MTPTTSPYSAIATRSACSEKRRRRSSQAQRHRDEIADALLARYVDSEHCSREVVAISGAMGSILVVDRDASTLGDRRLVAHLGNDEPPHNAAVVCGLYLNDSSRGSSRPVTTEDLQAAPFAEEQAAEPQDPAALAAVELIDRHGIAHRLQVLGGGRCSRELRWSRCSSCSEEGELQPVSVRDLVASLESYQPARSLTAAAIASYRDNPAVSVASLRIELGRVNASALTLNRGLREAVLAAVEHRDLTMSQIAVRCGRVKRDTHGHVSGETSWLARRVGLIASAGNAAPTPWVHSDVLALIARQGLGVSPRDVELG
jgi:hypothetical protein